MSASKRTIAGVAVVALMVGIGYFPAIAVPNANDTAKADAFVFSPGRYILGGGANAATAQDVYEFKKPFILRPNQYILSGGTSATLPIVVDDDLEVYSSGKPLFIDDDHVASTDTRGNVPRMYDGTPIILVLEPGKKLQIRAIDCFPNDAILGELYLHRYDGARKKLTDAIKQQSAGNLPNVFFDQDFSLSDGFEAPPSPRDAIQVPEVPARLLGRGAK